jgi:hypothetical protein
MKKNERLGAILTLIATVIGIAGHYMIFINWYEPALTLEGGEPGSEILLKYIMPLMFDLGILGAALYAVSAYGFFTARTWAFPLAAIATVLALQSSWFVNIPLMAADAPPVYFALFWPYLGLFFLLMWLVGRVPWLRTILALFTGMTYIFSFMNGVASMNRILLLGTPLFVAVQRLHWVAMIGWGVVTVAILLHPSEWARIVGLVAGVLELIVGIPLGIATTVQLGRFSMFSIAPIFSLALIVVFIWPAIWEKLTGSTVS